MAAGRTTTDSPPTLSRRPPGSGRRGWRSRPWWIPFFLGRVPELPAPLLTLLGLVSLALFFEGYDASMLNAALKYIAEDLAMAEEDLGFFTSAIRLGALPSLLVVPLADRLGRRRVFLASVLGFSATTCATGFARSPAEFVFMQMVCRTFMIAAAATSVVIITEEFPAKDRGWGLGMMGALAACGHGLGAALFAAIEYLPYGWRALYVFGLAPLLLFPLLRRGVAETHRYLDHHQKRIASGDSTTGLAGWARPLKRLFTSYRGRMAGLTAVSLFAAFGAASVFQFSGYYLLKELAWTPGQYSLMVIVAGAFGIIGNVAAGRLGDRIGRRGVGVIFLVTFPAAAWLFFNGRGSILPLAWMMVIFSWTACDVIMKALSTELFPTSYRGTASGWLIFTQTLGWAGGLGLNALTIEALGGMARTTWALSLLMLGATIALLFLPETRRRELEDISQDQRG